MSSKTKPSTRASEPSFDGVYRHSKPRSDDCGYYIVQEPYGFWLDRAREFDEAPYKITKGDRIELRGPRFYRMCPLEQALRFGEKAYESLGVLNAAVARARCGG